MTLLRRVFGVLAVFQVVVQGDTWSGRRNSISESPGEARPTRAFRRLLPDCPHTENGDAEATDVDRRQLVVEENSRDKDDGDLLEDTGDGAVDCDTSGTE